MTRFAISNIAWPADADDRAIDLVALAGYQGIELTAAHPMPYPVEEVLALTGSRSEIVYRPLPPGDPKVRRPDIARARTMLGWEPRIGRREGFKRTIDDFAKRLGRSASVV